MPFLSKVSSHLARHSVAYGLITISAVIQLLIVSQPLEFLLATVLPDDAFYYFEIARNITQGLGSTFDGTNLTNGYHPLWLLTLIPIFTHFSSGGPLDIEPVRAALHLAVFFNVITACVLYRILGYFTKDRVLAAFGLFAYLFNPFVLFETVNGLETALSLLLVSVFFLVTLRLQEKDTTRTYVLLGLIGGAMILARLDTAFYAAAVLCWVLFRKGFKYGFPRAVGSGLIICAVVVPLFVVNYMTFGMVLTSASQTGTLVSHTLNAQDNGTSLFEVTKATVYHFYNGVDQLLLTRTGAPWLFLILFGVWCASLIRSGKIPRRLSDIQAIHALGLGFVLLFLANVVVRWGGRPWYFMSFEFFVSIMAVLAVASLSLSGRYKQITVLLLAVLMTFFFYVSWSKEIRNQHVNQVEMYSMASWMNEQPPEDARVGVFNAGIIGYFSTREVINLDGLVNNAVFHAMEERRVWEYIANERIAYIADFPLSLTYRYKSFFGVEDIFMYLQPRHTILLTPTNRNPEGIVLYEVVVP